MSNVRNVYSPDVGSVAPLGIGLALLSLSAMLAFTAASSIFLLQRRLITLSVFASLSGARYGLSAEVFLRESGPSGMTGLRVEADQVLDGVTRQVTICSRWQSPFPAFTKFLQPEICGSGAARAG
jgi:hypothetical protein